MVAFSRSSCSNRSCSSRVKRFGGAAGFGTGIGVGVAIGAGVATATFGGSGTSMRSSVPPAAIVMSSPPLSRTIWAKMPPCFPTGLVLSAVMGKAISFESFVTSSTVVVTLAGSPRIVTFALPSNGAAMATLQNNCVAWPCSTAGRSIVSVIGGGAISIENNWLDTHTGPLPASLTAVTAVFHLRGTAFGAAFMANVVSVASGAIVAALAMPMPGGVHSGNTVIAPLNPAARFATTRRLNEPFCTTGTFGSITSMLKGAMSVTANAFFSTMCRE